MPSPIYWSNIGLHMGPKTKETLNSYDPIGREKIGPKEFTLGFDPRYEKN